MVVSTVKNGDIPQVDHISAELKLLKYKLRKVEK